MAENYLLFKLKNRLIFKSVSHFYYINKKLCLFLTFNYYVGNFNYKPISISLFYYSYVGDIVDKA